MPAADGQVAGRAQRCDELDLVVEADDRELVSHLRAVLSDADLRTRLSEGALKHAAAFTWHATAASTLEVLVGEAHRRRGRR